MPEFFGTVGNDRIVTDELGFIPIDDLVHGGDGDDFIFAGAGRDTLTGDAGSDTLLGGADNDLLDGGAGLDTASYEFAPEPVIVSLAISGPQDTGVAGFDTLLNIENLKGGEYNDTLTGNAAANVINGLAGDDLIIGGGGLDYIRGDDGNDSLLGGADFDDANGNTGNDTVSTGAGDDYCVGGKDNDSLAGGSGYDLVYGNLGNDTCNGDDGNDIVRGGQGNDVVNGGNGDDFVSGDKGDDTMTGGAGADIFHTFGDAGLDRVTDFSLAQGDRVQLDPGTQFTVSQVGADTVINMTGGGQMILVGVAMASLTGNWIFGA